jgi:hypothetical protein
MPATEGEDKVELINEVWQKSSHSGHNACVEVAFVGQKVAVRNSMDPNGPVLVFSSAEWQAFVNGVCDGELHAADRA